MTDRSQQKLTAAQLGALAEAVLFTREEWRQLDDDPVYRRKIALVDRAWDRVSPTVSLTDAAGYEPTGNSFGEYRHTR